MMTLAFKSTGNSQMKKRNNLSNWLNIVRDTGGIGHFVCERHDLNYKRA